MNINIQDIYPFLEERRSRGQNPRFNLSGQPQHLIQRGNNHQDIFDVEDDYLYFPDKFALAADKHECKIHAYVLMTNHVHCLLTPKTEDGIGKMMQMIGRYYVQYFNQKYKRTGILWEGRYRATLIDTEQYLLTWMRYIELNPVRAMNMVEHPSEYKWSSYRGNALGQTDKIVTPHREYKRLGANEAERLIAYRQLFRGHITEHTLNEIREATNKAWVLENERFIKKIFRKLFRQLRSEGHGGDRKSDEYLKIKRV